MAKSEVLYFWWSQGQALVEEDQDRLKHGKALLRLCSIEGRIRQYSECRRIKKPTGSWDDYVFLGRGTIESVS